MTDDILLSEQELILQRTVHDFAQRELAPRARQIDETEEFPWDNINGIVELGLFGLGIDPAYGGAGGGYKDISIVLVELARACAATSLIYGAHLSLGTLTIARFGTEEQKQRFLPTLARGERIVAFALSEPGAGCDAAALVTT
ncbi:MAG: acyl-CoA dehydrogenase family protein, partial [Dehalococcoidia bacterium]